MKMRVEVMAGMMIINNHVMMMVVTIMLQG